MPVSRFIPAFTFAEDRLAALKALAPEAFNADGRLDWDALKIALGEVVEDGATESFGLNWPGKRAARRLALTPVHKTLVPVPGEGVDEASTRNIFIEGDNLDALKLLRKAYAGRVKMIYIDPPYNTGNDFIYKDDFRESAEDYQQKTGQRGEEGERLVANPKSSGRFHSNWLNMIYPRLLLARDLLREDGVIFVSIDDNEVHNLRQVLDEVYGPENFVASLIWKSRISEDTRATTGVSTDHEYILCYGRSENSVLRGSEKDLDKFSNPDGDPRGPWRSADLTGLANREARPNLHYELVDPRSRIRYVCPPKGWRFDRTTMQLKIAEGRILFPAEPTGRPRHKLFLNDMKSLYKNISSVIVDVSTGDGSRELNTTLGSGIFQFPKPSRLIGLLIEQATEENDLVMDFFAGSATTAHALLEMNLATRLARQLILVQLPEKTTLPEFPTIADIGKERIRHVIKKLKAEQKEAAKAGTQAKSGNDKKASLDTSLDLGFKVFKTEDSPFRRWADFEGEDIPGYQARLDEAAEHPLRPGWVAEAVLTEIALQEGFPLDSATMAVPEFKRNIVRRVSHESSQHRLFVCLDERIYADTIANVHLGDQDIFICFDHALGDEAKLRLADASKLKVI